jgi:hypothetical protein
VIDRPDQAVAGQGERVGRHEAGIPESGDGRASGSGHGEQRAAADVFECAVLVVRDDRPFPPPPQVAASDPAVDQAQVAAEVQQRQVVERHPGPGRERAQFGPLGGKGILGGAADRGQAIPAR